MDMNRRRFLIGSGATAAAALLAACGGGSKGSSSSSSGGGSGSKASGSLELFTYDDTSTSPKVQQVLSAFKSSGGPSVTLDTLPGSGAAVYPGKLRTEMLAGKAPDVFRMWGGSIAKPFVDTRQVIDLAPYYSKYGWDTKLTTANISDLTYNNVKYGVPLYSAAVGIWYRTDLLAKAGSAVPKSFADVETLNAALKKAGVQPWLAGGKYGWYVMRFFEWFLEHTAGPAKHDQLRNLQTSWDTPEVVDAFGILKKWADQKWLPDGVMGLDPTQVEAQFAGGRGAMALDGQWIERTLVDQKVPTSKYDTIIPPTDQSDLRFSGFTEGYFIARQSKNPDEAAKLIDFFTQASSQKTLGNAYSPVKAVPASPAYPGTGKWKTWQSQYKHYVIQDQSLSTALANAYFSIQSDVVQGKQTPAAAATAMQKAAAAAPKS